jgi:hypothetical protein
VTFVLDASVTMSWLLRDTAARGAAYPFAVLNSLGVGATAAVVPLTWGLEIANVIARCEAKGQVSEAQRVFYRANRGGADRSRSGYVFSRAIGYAAAGAAVSALILRRVVFGVVAAAIANEKFSANSVCGGSVPVCFQEYAVLPSNTPAFLVMLF